MRSKLLLLAVFVFCLVSCDDAGLDIFLGKNCLIEDRAKFRDVTFQDVGFNLPTENEDKYSVIVLSDVHFHTGKRTSFIDVVNNIDFSKLGQPVMAVVLGDVGNYGEHSDYAEFNKFAAEINELLHIPIFSTVGNHDTYQRGNYGMNFLTDIFPTTFYRVGLHGVSWYFLDSADGTCGYNQINTLENIFMTDKNKKIICTHYPLYADNLMDCMSNYQEKAYLISLYSRNDVFLVLCGHTHVYFRYDFGTFEEIVGGNFNGDYEPSSFFVLSFSENPDTVFPPDYDVCRFWL